MLTNDWAGPLAAPTLLNSREAFIPEVPGIYLWRRCLQVGDREVCDQAMLIDFVNAALEAPFFSAEVLGLRTPSSEGKLTVRPDLVRIEGVSLGGKVLPREKADVLRSLTQKFEDRSFFASSLKNATQLFGPVVYVGEANCLLSRISDHLREGSPFRERLGDLDIHLDHVVLFFLPMTGTSKRQRHLFEYILTVLLLAPLTRRAG